MNINTKEENELLKALEDIKTVLEAKRNGDDMRLTIDIQQDIEKVLQQVKLTYPTVKYPISLINGGCGSCFSNFISDMIPVYDRLKKQQVNEIEGLNNQLVVDSANATDDIVDAVIDQYNKDLDNFNSKISEKLDNVIVAMKEEAEETKAPAKRGRRTKGK